MVYILYGKIDYLIKQEIENIFKNNNIGDIDISRYNLIEDSIDKIINDCNSLSLFDNKKGIIVSNSYIFTGSTSKNKEQNIEVLENYLNNINENVILVFIVDNETIDQRKKITKLIQKNGVVKEYNNVDVNNLVKAFFENYKINNDIIKLLISRVGENINLLYNEIQKIKIYKGNDLQITEDDILNLTCKTLEENNFKLIDSIINKNKVQAIELYEERLKSNEEPIAIIVSLANQIRIMYQVKGLFNQGHTENDIVSILGIHPYRVKLAIQKAKYYNLNDLLNYLGNLADLDYNIKIGNADKNLGLELFILNL